MVMLERSMGSASSAGVRPSGSLMTAGESNSVPYLGPMPSATREVLGLLAKASPGLPKTAENEGVWVILDAGVQVNGLATLVPKKWCA